MSELNRVTHDPKIIKTLEMKGITSLEQIALSSPTFLGLSERKAKQIIEFAMQTLAEDNIETMTIGRMKIEITMKKASKAIIDSVCHALDVIPDKNCVTEKLSNRITIVMKNGKRSAFKAIVKQAETLRDYMAAKKKQRMIDEGITLPKQTIIDFARKKKFQGFYEDFFSDIVGNELMKKTLTLSLFSTFEEPVHSLILGDPGSAKTLAKDILITNLGNITSIGANATRSGLVCNLSSGELGALAVSDRKLVLIDEFDKINRDDLEFCYELMSNGRCSVHSARVHKDIVSHFILVAFGNPKSEVFHKGMPLEDIGVERTLLSRFAFIVKTENLTRVEKEDLFRNRFFRKSKLSEHSQMFDQWVKLARSHDPKITASQGKINEFVQKAVKIAEQHATTKLRRDLRMGDYLRRIAMSFARVEFADVTDDVIDKAYDLIKDSIDVWRYKSGEFDFF